MRFHTPPHGVCMFTATTYHMTSYNCASAINSNHCRHDDANPDIFVKRERMLIFAEPLYSTGASGARASPLGDRLGTLIRVEWERRVSEPRAPRYSPLVRQMRFSLATRRFKQPLSNTASTVPHTYFQNTPKRRNVRCIIHAAMICMRRSPFILWAISVYGIDT